MKERMLNKKSGDFAVSRIVKFCSICYLEWCTAASSTVAHHTLIWFSSISKCSSITLSFLCCIFFYLSWVWEPPTSHLLRLHVQYVKPTADCIYHKLSVFVSIASRLYTSPLFFIIWCSFLSGNGCGGNGSSNDNVDCCYSGIEAKYSSAQLSATSRTHANTQSTNA